MIQRLSQFIEYLNISTRAFEQNISASNGLIRKAITNNTDIQSKWISEIVDKYPQLDIIWLLTGKGEMLKGKKEYSMDVQSIIEVDEHPMSVYNLTKDYYSQEKQLIPLYEQSASAGLSVIFSDQISQIPLDYISVPNAPKCDGALSIRGDSMYPILKSGDIACYKIIKNFDDIRFGEMYILDIEDSSDQYLTAKYVQRSDKGDEYLKLVSENKYHTEKDEHKSHIRALALIKMYIRMNTIS